ncbi:hypothetical protein PGIGA_G00101270 [Pangasianodon gigas]|uniref:Uncharacterized protein n=1 Tax=Pangasianodon gigas TaxID=30993 RepID=A0ACC5XEK1_PANGG|nr:hypothetical protein [Pangasianodon gigas]
MASPRLAYPEKFEGTPARCKGFLLQCSLFVSQQPALYPTEESRIAFVCSLLSGKALDWATAVWNFNRPAFSSFEAFLQRFREVFDLPEGGDGAGEQILTLHQGEKTAADFALSFRTLAAQTGWSDDPLKLLFRKGLNLELQAELACRDDGKTLDQLINLVIRIDNLIRSRRPSRGSALRSPSPPLMPEQEVMQANVLAAHQQQLARLTSLTEELVKTLQAIRLPSSESASPSVEPAPPPSHATASPRLAYPEKFDGTPARCKGFLLQCSLFVSQQPALYSTEESRIAFVCSLLSGKALDWATAVWNFTRPAFSSFEAFLQRFREVFDLPEGGDGAGEQILTLRQGEKTAADFALSFRTLAAQTGWSDDPLKLLFRKGLNLELQAELACRDEGKTLDQLINLAIRIDNLTRSRRPSRGSALRSPSPPLMPEQEAMQLQPPQPKRTYSADDLHHTNTGDLQDLRNNMFFKDKFDEEEEDSGIKSEADESNGTISSEDDLDHLEYSKNFSLKQTVTKKSISEIIKDKKKQTQLTLQWYCHLYPHLW